MKLKIWIIKFYDEGHFYYSQRMDNFNTVLSMLKEEGFKLSHKEEGNVRVYKKEEQSVIVYMKGNN